MSYEILCGDRLRLVDHHGKWLWPNTDKGAWTGPIGDWETSHREKYLKHTKARRVVVQAGGNCGLYPRLLSDLFDLVYTFEPDPLNFYCLVNNCQKDNIIKFQGALGETHQMVKIHRLTMGNVGMHKTITGEDATIPQFCIDDLELPFCDLILLDIEGYEINALKGAAKTIEKFNPTIVVEASNQTIVDFLSKFGYSAKEKSKMDTIFTK